MPISDTNIIDGPNVQADGQHRGTVEFIFADGRTFTRNVRAPDANSWANLVADLPAEVQAQVAAEDAEADIVETEDIAPNGEATLAQRAVGYLRSAYAGDHPYRAYRLMDKFNDWRQAQGYSVPQVRTALESEGMSAEEFDRIIAAYQYLGQPARVLAMDTCEGIHDFWQDRAI